MPSASPRSCRQGTGGISMCMSMRSISGPDTRPMYRSIANGEHLHGRFGSVKYPHGHGLSQQDADTRQSGHLSCQRGSFVGLECAREHGLSGARRADRSRRPPTGRYFLAVKAAWASLSWARMGIFCGHFGSQSPHSMHASACFPGDQLTSPTWAYRLRAVSQSPYTRPRL